jgi:hypothetical protein
VNLMTMPPLAKANLSVPGCWACEWLKLSPAPSVRYTHIWRRG